MQIPTIKIHIFVDDVRVGHFLMVPHSLHMYEIHLSEVDRKGKGHTVDISKQAIEFAFSNMRHLQKLIAMIPSNNRHAVAVAMKLGFKKEGTLSKSFMYEGSMIDSDVYGLSREDICQ